MFVRNGYLPVRVRLTDDEMEALTLVCPQLPTYRSAYLRAEMFQRNRDTLAYAPARLDTLQDCLRQLFVLHLNDSLYLAPTTELIEDAHYELPHVLLVLDVAHLDRGRQVLRLAIAEERRGKVLFDEQVRLPFWIE